MYYEETVESGVFYHYVTEVLLSSKHHSCVTNIEDNCNSPCHSCTTIRPSCNFIFFQLNSFICKHSALKLVHLTMRLTTELVPLIGLLQCKSRKNCHSQSFCNQPKQRECWLTDPTARAYRKMINTVLRVRNLQQLTGSREANVEYNNI